MKSLRRVGLATALVVAGLACGSAFAATKIETFVGQVGDAACGVRHMMGGSDADCTRTCVRGGAKYALIVGYKVYILDTGDKALLQKLDALAGQ